MGDIIHIKFDPIHVHHHGSDVGSSSNDSILAAVEKLGQKIDKLEKQVMVTSQDIIDAGAAQTTVINSAIAVMDALFAKVGEIIASGQTQEQMQAQLDQLNLTKQAIADAIVRDTIAADEPPAPVV